MLDEPRTKRGASQRTVLHLVERERRGDAQFFERAYKARFPREHVRLDVEDLHDRYTARHGTVDERLLTIEVRGEIVFAPVGALTERFLGVDDEQAVRPVWAVWLCDMMDSVSRGTMTPYYGASWCLDRPPTDQKRTDSDIARR